VHGDVARRLGPQCTDKAVEHKLARAVLLLELLIEEAYRTGKIAQCDKIFARLNAHRHIHLTNAANALRRHVVADATEHIELATWQERQDAAARRREIDALAEEVAGAELLMVQLEVAK
jgi:hypothetical protein